MKNQADHPLKVIQITDTHLFSDDSATMYEVKSNMKFKEVMNQIYQEDLKDTNMIFLTGDLSQDETEKSYEILATELNKLNIPIYWIPGNHDNMLAMEKAFQHANKFIQTRCLSLKNWHFIFLNTKIDGCIEGFLSTKELFELKNEIAATESEKSIAIIMHHHPYKVNTPLIDQFILKNSDHFWEIVSGTAVKLIMCGHVHGDYQLQYKNINIETSPATCLQWKKGTHKLKMENKIGYKLYYFYPNSYQATAKLW